MEYLSKYINRECEEATTVLDREEYPIIKEILKILEREKLNAIEAQEMCLKCAEIVFVHAINKQFIFDHEL